MGFALDKIRVARLFVPALLLLSAIAGAQELRNSAFHVQYNDEGIVSLRRTNYIANGASFGRVVARYRTSPQGDWREIGQLTLDVYRISI